MNDPGWPESFSKGMLRLGSPGIPFVRLVSPSRHDAARQWSYAVDPWVRCIMGLWESLDLVDVVVLFV